MPDHNKLLHDKRIDTHVDKLTCKALSLSKLTLVENGIERDIYSHTKEVGIGNNTCYVVGRVCGTTTGTKLISANIQGIGTTIDSCHRRTVVACGA